jgi:hypothetical protein
MTLTDKTLHELFSGLDPRERKAVERHVRFGVKSQESLDAIRKLRRKLKRKIRARVRRFKWLA